MAHDFDAIVIGSGFGGAVSACRLSEAGAKVLVLERGRRWAIKDYPRHATDAWIFDHKRPEKRNGWIDLRIFPHMAVAQGAGVGGGSLIYANISVEPKPDLFDKGWPPEITYAELKPHFDRVAKTMNVQTIPERQATNRMKLMREAAETAGYGDRWRPLPLAVTFDPDYSYDRPEPFSDKNSKTWTNAQGVEQGTCVHCGNCDIGCQVKAKNTLDLNYLAWAEKKGAEIRPLHLVTVIEPHEDGYRVHWHRIEGGRRVPGSATGSRVILTAGSLSSTELLLRARDQHKTLPNVSQRLGWNWSSNGDFLTPAIHRGRKVSPTRGPTISSAIDFLDGAVSGQQFFIEDGGFPDVLGNHWAKAKGSWFGRNPQGFLFGKLSQALADRDTLESVMPWFAQGIDAGDGRLRLGRRWYWPFGEKRLMLDWDIARSKGVIDAIVSMHKTLAKRTGGVPLVPITWTWMQNLITPHPLGGCNMGTSPENGVVDHKGEVFGHPGLIVSDGAIVPEALGLNPTRTIAALAERNVAKLIATA